DLAGMPAQALGEISPGGARVGQRLATLESRGEVAVAQFQRGDELAGTSGTEPGQRCKLARTAFEQGAQRAVRGEQGAGGGHRVLAAQAGAEEDRQKFGVRERAGGAGDELLAGAFGGGPVADLHGEASRAGTGNGEQGTGTFKRLQGRGGIGVKGRFG